MARPMSVQSNRGGSSAKGAGFWKRVALAMPDYAARKRWLDERGGDYA
ncbi:MAG TPA: hypothetical protein VGP33_13955 [Chloroflexota bacterium]|nr:hypothetical protein [Chloroflexota bacterium]